MEFYSKLDRILADEDGSKKSFLLANMTFPILDIINLFDKPDMFNQIILRRTLKKK